MNNALTKNDKWENDRKIVKWCSAAVSGTQFVNLKTAETTFKCRSFGLIACYTMKMDIKVTFLLTKYFKLE